MAILKNTNIDSTGFLDIASGITSERPSNPQTGSLFYNTSDNVLEIYANGAWKQTAITDQIKGGQTSCFFTSMQNSANVNRNTGFTRFDVFNTNPVINQGGFQVTNREITIPYSGVYKIAVHVHYQLGSGGNNGGSYDYRPKVRFKIAFGNQLDTITAQQAYIRNASGHGDSSVIQSQVRRLAEGTTIQLYFASGNSTYRRACDIVGEYSGINIIHLGA